MHRGNDFTPRELAALLGRSRRTVALTGAGISTAAGIPDFRGPNGLYITRRYDPEKVFHIGWFHREPHHFYQFALDFARLGESIRPTFSHRFLARLAAQGMLAGIVTQNIDLLHQEAGSSHVIELHGSFASATCQGCGHRLVDLGYKFWLTAMDRSPRSPIVLCDSCGGLLKPDIVFFGEQVNRFAEAEALVECCDLLLVLGSSLSVSPASYLPHRTGAPIVAINRGEVQLEKAPHHHLLDADLDSSLRDVAAHLGMDDA